MKITGHTEAVRVIYDNRIASFQSICDAFWGSHDPTNKEYLEFGIDKHLRSVIFCANEEQKKLARESKVRQQMKLDRRIVTRILARDSCFVFYLAETRHQKHYLQRDHTGLCESLALRSTQHFVDSHLACKLNGILEKCDRSVAVEDLKRVMDAHKLPEKTRLALVQTAQELSK
ncbi:Peptide methionine sulfoxide reductase A1 [Acorus calamus]|uniref:peptide-methionine (S)-S-oxide reductase n=1 Tax=Acorus calamus TaxID=4465 RepID=A0AAV9FII4_ACOCL|nr:Peptide methionine sulfoxide reductase A1 [Acorus calamus]